MGFGGPNLEEGGAVGGGGSVDGTVGLGETDPLATPFMVGEWCGLRGTGLGLGLGVMLGLPPSTLSPDVSLCGKVGVPFPGRGGFRFGFEAGTGTAGLVDSVVL